MSNRLLRLAFLILALATTGTLIWDFVFNGDHDTILGLTAFAIGVVTLFGFMRLNLANGQSGPIPKGDLRTALAAALIVTYLFLVVFEVFLVGPEAISPLAKALIESFTAVVGLTVAFYFGTTAVLRAFGKSDEAENESSQSSEGEK